MSRHDNPNIRTTRGDHEPEGPMFVTWAQGEDAPLGSVASNYNIVQKSYGNHRSFENIDTDTSVRQGFTRTDYEFFRPSEAVPKRQKARIGSCMEAYKKVGIVRNVIDMMGDFGCQGIRLRHPNKRIEKLCNNWFKKVHGVERSERFMNLLYRGAVVIVRRHIAKLQTKDVQQMRTSASLEPDTDFIRDEKPKKNAIPIKYRFMNPMSVDVIGDELATFVGKPIYGLKLSAALKRKIRSPKNSIEKKLVEGLPEEVKRAAQGGASSLVPLDPDRVFSFFYKKDDWQVWPDPMLYSIIDDLNLLEKMKLADLAALDGVISHVRLWRLGDLKERIFPTDAAVSKLANILMNNVGGGAIDLIWGPDLDLVETSTEAYKWLGSEKYGPVYQSIYQGLGIPATLTGNSSNSGGFTNNFISMKTMIERLEYGRNILVQFWNQELKILQQALGLRFPAEVVFDHMSLSDESAEKQLLINLVDRNIISIETLQERFGEIPELEILRLRREDRARQGGTLPLKGGPFEDPQQEFSLKKIFAQSGQITPGQAGVELDEPHDGEMTQTELALEMDKRRRDAQQAQKGQPGEGRPKNSKDSDQRKQRTPKPRSSAFVSAQVWAAEAQEKIAKIVNPLLLKSFGKKNLRQLTTEEMDTTEQFKFRVLSKFKPFSEINQSSVAKVVRGKDLKLEPAMAQLYKELKDECSRVVDRELTIAEDRRVQVTAYGLINMGQKMAQFTINVNTDDKTLSVAVNGETLENVDSVYISKYKDYEDEEKVNISVNTSEKSEDGVKKFTSVVAKEIDVKIDVKQPNVNDAVAKYFENRR